MIKKITVCLAFASFNYFVAIAQSNKIILEGDVPNSFIGDSVIIEAYTPSTVIDYHFTDDSDWKEYVCPVKNGKFKWVKFTDEPMYVKVAQLKLIAKRNRYIRSIMEPGDSVHVSIALDETSYTGKGADNFKLSEEALLIEYKLKPDALPLLERYLYISQRCDSITTKRKQILEKYEHKLTPFAYLILKADWLEAAEHTRMNAFGSLRSKRRQAGLSAGDLVRIFDSTVARSEVLKIPVNDTTILSAGMTAFYCREYNYDAFCRSRGFSDAFFEEEKDKQRADFYYYTKERYNGLAQRKILTAVLTVYMLRKGGTPPEYLACVSDFASMPGDFPQKDYVKKYLERMITLEEGAHAPDFSLTGENGRLVSLADLKGKIVVMDFWFTGCAGCAQMAPFLRKVEQQFLDSPNVVFVSISIDGSREKWLRSIKQGKYTSEHSLNLYTGGKGDQHPVLKAYNVSSYPRMFIIDARGRMAQYPAPSPMAENGKLLADCINKELAQLKDGPYVLYRNNTIISKAVGPDKKGIITVDSSIINNKHSLVLPVATDTHNKSFTVTIKRSLQAEPSTFSKPVKMLVLSDIEGNFDALRKLLQSNRIIDSNYNWTFDKGHLVCVGDFFDRGEQVTECLWLIYSLEEKAKAAGGYVHFILGNHEIMNLNGSMQYVQKKYTDNAKLLKEKYLTLWGRESELGRWLRTKNVMEKIGDVLVTHGGISKEVNELPLSIESINTLARQYYDRNYKTYKPNTPEFVLFNTSTSPFWYRGYYTNDNRRRSTIQQVDSTLRKFNVDKIITGHTINKSGNIGAYYNGKVINTDTEHKKGRSQALLSLNNVWYYVDTTGKQKLLRINREDDRIKLSLSK